MTLNQYIITGDEITALFEQELSELELEAICRVIRSHPYQSERETILLSCIKSGNIIEAREALEHLFDRHNTCKSERTRCPLCREELRKAGEQE